MTEETKQYRCDTVEALTLELRRFASERNWERYHTPKNLASALIVEAAELLEHFQWLSQEESQNLSAEVKTEVAHEIADVFIYLTRLSDRLGIDMLAAASEKMGLNAKKYPPLPPVA
ncbi:MAG: nucleotide pyrophosphohydrolase [Desulfobulbus sp.]|nr:nucleotide pyrophosphohydrolase [Desulfobulbus sp.]